MNRRGGARIASHILSVNQFSPLDLSISFYFRLTFPPITGLAEMPDSSTQKNKKKRVPNMNAGDFKDTGKVLAELRRLRSSSATKKKVDAQAILATMSDVREVEDVGNSDVARRIEEFATDLVRQILQDGHFSMDVPNRAASNQKYIESIDRIVLGDKVSKRQFLNTAHVRKSAITTRVMQLVHEVVEKKIHITKRDLVSSCLSSTIYHYLALV